MTQIGFWLKGIVKTLFLVILSYNPVFNSAYAGKDYKIEFIQFTEREFIPGDNQALNNACQKWELTGKQVERLLRISHDYKNSAYAYFKKAPCNIKGKVFLYDQFWEFSVNGSGVITIDNGKNLYYKGCKAAECARYLIQ